MLKKTKYQLNIFITLIVVLNAIALIFVGIVFLGASNANGEGRTFESGLIYFLRQFSYIIAISLAAAVIVHSLKLMFQKYLPVNKVFVKRIFWIEFVFIIFSFLLMYVYMAII